MELMINKDFIKTLTKNEDFIRKYSEHKGEKFMTNFQRFKNAGITIRCDKDFGKYLIRYGFAEKEIYNL